METMLTASRIGTSIVRVKWVAAECNFGGNAHSLC